MLKSLSTCDRNGVKVFDLLSTCARHGVDVLDLRSPVGTSFRRSGKVFADLAKILGRTRKVRKSAGNLVEASSTGSQLAGHDPPSSTRSEGPKRSFWPFLGLSSSYPVKRPKSSRFLEGPKSFSPVPLPEPPPNPPKHPQNTPKRPRNGTSRG